MNLKQCQEERVAPFSNPLKKKLQQEKWILIRNGEVRNVFDNRKEAVKHLKKLLKQALKDFDKQDKTDEYNYPIKIFGIEIKPVEFREAYLGL